MTLPDPLRDTFSGTSPIGELDQAFLLLTVAANGAVNTCLLSRTEVHAGGAGFLAVVASRRARANLAERPVATLTAVCDNALHTFTLGVANRVDEPDASAFELRVVDHQVDGMDIELHPMLFRCDDTLPTTENWTRTAELMARLAPATNPGNL